MKNQLLRILLSGTLSLLFAWTALPARAEEASDLSQALGLVSDEPVTTSRFPRLASQIAENVTIVTADDMARLNAHTLAEVLQTVPGIQMDYLRTPGAGGSFFSLQGALNTTVLILIDGIRQNDFIQNVYQVNVIPIQQIDRIEIVKGAASAAWGPALGGVVNIITKSPDTEHAATGMFSQSLGSRLTSDSRAEVSGTVGRSGYYLSAGNLHSAGLTPNTPVNLANIYAKYAYLLPSDGTATFAFSHLADSAGLDEGNTAKWGFVHDDNRFRRTSGVLKLSQPLGPRLSLEMDGYLSNSDDHAKWGGLDNNGAVAFFNDNNALETVRGANARLAWGDRHCNLAAGFEYSHVRSRFADLMNADPTAVSDHTFDRFGFYLNGAYSIGALTILPSVREDLTGISGDNLSYTLGATYQLGESTTLRAYGAKGFSLPLANRENDLQKIKTVQAGIENGSLPFLWLKATYFFNALRNSESVGQNPTVSDQDRQGFEVEGRTTPLSGFSLVGGYTFVFARDVTTGARIQTGSGQSLPPHVLKLALNYDNAQQGLRGALTGSFVRWNGADFPPTADQGMIWDLHLNWKLYPDSDLSPELFFSGRNLFNGNQTVDTTLYNTAPRWYEGGARFRF